LAAAAAVIVIVAMFGSPVEIRGRGPHVLKYRDGDGARQTRISGRMK